MDGEEGSVFCFSSTLERREEKEAQRGDISLYYHILLSLIKIREGKERKGTVGRREEKPMKDSEILTILRDKEENIYHIYIYRERDYIYPLFVTLFFFVPPVI